MEKASTPPNRLTRSAAKQVNTSSKKEESIEDANISTRKPRRKAETKLKTNGEAVSNTERKITKHYEEVSDSYSIDSCESEDSNLSTKQSSKINIRNSPRMTPRKSLRNKPQGTPCPELEISMPKTIKRSTSESKLGSISTPRNKRGRANSESKDFVFTPSKTDDDEKVNSPSKSSNNNIHRNSVLRVIYESVEASEVDESSQDEHQCKPLNSTKKVDPYTNMPQDEESKILNETNKISLISEPLVLESEKNIDIDHVLKEVNENQSCDHLAAAKEDSHILPANKIELISCTDNSENDKIKKENVLKEDSKMQSIVKTESVCGNINSDYDSQRLLDKIEENEIQIDDSQNDKYSSNEIDITGDDYYDDDLSNFKSDVNVHRAGEHLDSIQSINETGELIVIENNRFTSLNNDCKSDIINPITENIIKSSSSQELNVEIIADGQIDISSGNDFISEISSEVNENTTYENKDVTASTILNHDKVTSNLPHQADSLMQSNNVNIHKEIIEKDTNHAIEKEQNESDTIESNFINTESDMVMLDVGDTLKHDIIIEEKDNSKCNIDSLDGHKMPDKPVHEPFKIINPMVNLKENENCSIKSKTSQSGVVMECNIGIDVQIGNSCTVVDVNDSYLQIDSELDNVSTHDFTDKHQSEHFVMDREPNQSLSINEHTITEIQKTDYSEPELRSKNGELQTEIHKINKPYSRELITFQDTYESESSVKNENSDSDSDIYKDMSDIGCEGKDGANEHKYDDSRTSECGSAESEEEISSLDGDGSNHKDSSDKLVPLSVVSEPTKECQNNEGDCKKKNEKLFDTSSPMTYDKALAILNKNRVKKIDDEEFFDMFTQELNRVSAESSSDSDIAIVDEYIMDPEEANESNLKTSNSHQLHCKVSTNSHSPTRSSMHLSEHLAGMYNKQFPSQRNNPLISNTSISQGSLYGHHYGQNIMAPVHTGKGPVMYDQYTQGPMTMPDPRTFNPSHLSSDMHFNRSVPYVSHALEPSSNSHIHYPNTQSLKVKSINSLNNSQNSIKLVHHGHLSALEKNIHGDGCDYGDHDFNRNATISASTMTDKDSKQDQATSYSSPLMKGNQSMVNVLEELGLNEEKLQLLKMALGLEGFKSFNNKHKKKTLQKVVCKKKRSVKKKSRKRLKLKTASRKKEASKRLIEYDNNSSTTEHSNDNTSNNIERLTDKNIVKNECSSDDISDHESRQINVEGDNVSVTLKTIPQISPNHQLLYEFDTLSESSQNWQNLVKKRKRADHIKYKNPSKILIPSKRKGLNAKPSNYNEAYDSKIQHFKQKAKRFKWGCPKNTDKEIFLKTKRPSRNEDCMKHQQTLLKSNCGIFTIDSMAATSQSSGTSDPDINSSSDQEAGPSNLIQEISQKKKSSLDSPLGKNKLSRLFSDHSLKKIGASSKIEKLQRKKKAALKTLPIDILEGLLDEEYVGEKSLKLNSGSEEGNNEPRKKRKRAPKLKLTSKVAGRGYIPCVTSGPTQFSLSRLDDDSLVSAAEIAAKFRTDQLYGSSVKRVTILDFKG